MVSEQEVEAIAKLADLTIKSEKVAGFTRQFNSILEYFDLLDEVDMKDAADDEQYNVLREDEIIPSLTQEEALANADESEEGYIKSPKVM